eukprot:500092-Pelagomonas_calceolata.AAC.9
MQQKCKDLPLVKGNSQENRNLTLTALPGMYVMMLRHLGIHSRAPMVPLHIAHLTGVVGGSCPQRSTAAGGKGPSGVRAAAHPLSGGSAGVDVGDGACRGGCAGGEGSSGVDAAAQVLVAVGCDVPKFRRARCSSKLNPFLFQKIVKGKGEGALLAASMRDLVRKENAGATIPVNYAYSETQKNLGYKIAAHCTLLPSSTLNECISGV